MIIDDVSSHSYGERHEHYRRQYGIGSADEVNKLNREQFEDRLRMATDATQAEMLNEIHVMLRTLLDIKDSR